VGFLQSRVLALCVVLLRANHCWVACGLEISQNCLVCAQSPPRVRGDLSTVRERWRTLDRIPS
jgi:hypothetical protein